MSSRLKLFTGIISYTLSFFLIIYYLIIEFSIINVYSPIYRSLTIFIIVSLMYIGGLLLKKTDNIFFNKVYKLNLYVWFILYITMLLNLTLFDKYFNRQIDFNGVNTIKDYMIDSFNIKPFHTIVNYFIAIKNNNLPKMNFIYNIFGNLFAFVPLSLFLPRVIKHIDKWPKYFLASSILIIIIEIMQMLTHSGSCDIDDYILNIIGSMLFYFIFNNKYLKDKINKFVFLKEGDV